MRGQRNYFKITLLISIVVAIIFPLMAMGFTFVWVICSIILLGYVFLLEGRRNRIKLIRRVVEVGILRIPKFNIIRRIKL